MNNTGLKMPSDINRQWTAYLGEYIAAMLSILAENEITTVLAFHRLLDNNLYLVLNHGYFKGVSVITLEVTIPLDSVYSMYELGAPAYSAAVEQAAQTAEVCFSRARNLSAEHSITSFIDGLDID